MTSQIFHFSKVVSVQVDRVTGVAVQVTWLSSADDIQFRSSVDVDGAVVSNPRMITDTNTCKLSQHW